MRDPFYSSAGTPPFSFDGHGINDVEGQRVCKVQSCEPYVYDSGQPVRNDEFDRLSNTLATAPDGVELARQLVEWDEEHENLYSEHNPAVKRFVAMARSILSRVEVKI